MPRKKVVKKEVKAVKPEEKVTDILEEYFFDDDGAEKIKKTFLNGDKVIKTEIVTS